MKKHVETAFGIDSSACSIHQTNYRIAFDAMRAYHVSEIEHKKDMVSILNGILISIVTVYAGVFVFVVSDIKVIGYDTKIIGFIGIIVVAILYWIMITWLGKESVDKIKGDNNRYEKFRNECHIEREVLGLQDFYSTHHGEMNQYWKIKKLPLNDEETKDISDDSNPQDQKKHWLKRTIEWYEKREKYNVKINEKRFEKLNEKLIHWGLKPFKKKSSDREGTGYVKTIAILKVYIYVLCIIVTILSIIACTMLHFQIIGSIANAHNIIYPLW